MEHGRCLDISAWRVGKYKGIIGTWNMVGA